MQQVCDGWYVRDGVQVAWRVMGGALRLFDGAHVCAGRKFAAASAAMRFIAAAAKSVLTFHLDSDLLSSAADLAGLALSETQWRLAWSCYQHLKYLDTRESDACTALPRKLACPAQFIDVTPIAASQSR